MLIGHTYLLPESVRQQARALIRRLAGRGLALQVWMDEDRSRDWYRPGECSPVAAAPVAVGLGERLPPGWREITVADLSARATAAA